MTPRERAEAEAKAIMDRVMGRTPPQPARVRVSQPRKPAKRSVPAETRNGAHRPGSGVPVQRVRDLYAQGLRVAEISRSVGIHVDTVRNALRWHGDWSPATTSGPRRKEVCKRGHSLAVHGKPASKGGRRCSECKRIRERVGFQKPDQMGNS